MRGSEAGKRRPAVVVSNDAANATAARLGRGVVTVAPVTSNVERVHPFQVLLTRDGTGLPRDAKVHAEQVRSVAIERVGRPAGWIPRPCRTSMPRCVFTWHSDARARRPTR